MALAGTGFSLEIRPVGGLLPHEQTIPSHVQGMVRQLREDGLQKDPMIVDGKTGTVLDGMHRLAAFKELGIRNAVCCTVDYGSERIGLGRWGRLYSVSTDDAERLLSSAGLRRKVSPNEALKMLGERTESIAGFSRGTAYLQKVPTGLQGAFDSVNLLDRTAESGGWRRKFVPDDEPMGSETAPGQVVVLVRRLDKADVISAALHGPLFPCKTSMHIIDPRPVAVDYPIGRLDGANGPSLSESAKGGRLLPSGSVYEGRRYKERLIVLSRR